VVRCCALGAVVAALACGSADAALTHSWHADGDAVDAVGAANGTLNNGAAFAPGLTNQGFSLDGDDDTVTFGTSAGNVGSGDFTVAFAIKTPNPTDRAVILSSTSCASPTTPTRTCSRHRSRST